MRRIVFLPIGLIEQANEDDWLRSLSYFVRLKSLYHNNTFYNFSLRRLSEQLKCSPEALRVHLRVLNQKGLIRYHNKNITFIGLEKLKQLCGQRCKKVLNVPVFKDTLTILRGKIVQLNLNRQAYNFKRKETIISARLKQRRDTHETCEHNVSLSNKGFGRLFNRSTATGNVIKKKLVAYNQITATRCVKVLVSNVSYDCFRTYLNNNMIPAYSKHYKGSIIIDTPSLIEFNDTLRNTMYLINGLR